MICESTGPHLLDFIKFDIHTLSFILRVTKWSFVIIWGNIHIGKPLLGIPKLLGLLGVKSSLTIFINLEWWQECPSLFLGVCICWIVTSMLCRVHLSRPHAALRLTGYSIESGCKLLAASFLLHYFYILVITLRSLINLRSRFILFSRQNTIFSNIYVFIR